MYFPILFFFALVPLSQQARAPCYVDLLDDRHKISTETFMVYCQKAGMPQAHTIIDCLAMRMLEHPQPMPDAPLEFTIPETNVKVSVSIINDDQVTMTADHPDGKGYAFVWYSFRTGVCNGQFIPCTEASELLCTAIKQRLLNGDPNDSLNTLIKELEASNPRRTEEFLELYEMINLINEFKEIVNKEVTWFGLSSLLDFKCKDAFGVPYSFSSLLKRLVNHLPITDSYTAYYLSTGTKRTIVFENEQFYVEFYIDPSLIPLAPFGVLALVVRKSDNVAVSQTIG